MATAAGPTITPDDRFGIDFISAPGVTFPNQAPRYAEASQAGASWNRWPLYWSNVEASCNGVYDWSQSDGVINADFAQGIKIDAILMGTPYCYATTYGTASVLPLDLFRRGGMTTLSLDTRSPPTGLYLPTFSDNTDVWAPGKTINQANVWARFVNAYVSRYQSQIQYWEMWNEPDNSGFWAGSLTDFVRLLKVGYLAAHAANSQVHILVGGMMYWQWANAYGSQAWLSQFLAQVTGDPSAASNGFYFDIVPWHWYSRSSDVYNQTAGVQSILNSWGVTGKELWLNETNSPACNDSGPGVSLVGCGSGSSFPPGFANDTEQASFIMQAIAYAFDVGITKIFHFQLQDDGNGEAFGMYRNDGSVRPVYLAYQLTAQYLEGWSTVRRTVVGSTEMISFGVPGAHPHRTTMMWNDSGQTTTQTVTAMPPTPTSVNLIQQTGSIQSLAGAPSYSLSLSPATDNRNYDSPWNPNDYTVGGPTVLLVENLPSDTTPPKSAVAPLPSTIAPLSTLLTWTGTDAGGWGVFDYTIQYNDVTASTGWVSILTNTTLASTFFTPVANHTYEFRSLARDWAGNVENKGTVQFDTTTVSSARVQTSWIPVIVVPGIASGW